MSFSYTRCEDFIARMNDAIAAGTPDDPRARQGLGGGEDPTWVETLEAVQEAGITRSDFIELDERPGRFDHRYTDGGWFRLLRILRNEHTDELFDQLTENEGK